jgi:hypothetical protein
MLSKDPSGRGLTVLETLNRSRHLPGVQHGSPRATSSSLSVSERDAPGSAQLHGLAAREVATWGASTLWVWTTTQFSRW